MGERAVTDSEIDVTALFGSSDNQISSDQFRGGRALSVFGSSEIDLRRAATGDGGATLKVIVGFGSVRLLVPEDWAVNVHSRALFGGVASKRVAPASPSGQLTLTGFCLFGGVEVRS